MLLKQLDVVRVRVRVRRKPYFKARLCILVLYRSNGAFCCVYGILECMNSHWENIFESENIAFVCGITVYAASICLRDLYIEI